MRQTDIIKIANEKSVHKTTIDKDWVLGHLLNTFYSFIDNRANFIFKGGTCLRKCFFVDYRFSEDLDFTLLKPGFDVSEKWIRKILNTTGQNCNAKFYLDELKMQLWNDIPQGYQIAIKFWGADHHPNQRPLPASRWLTKIHIDISFSEKSLLEPINRKIYHPYSDNENIVNNAPCYQITEILSEKIRSLAQRNRPRDCYDVWFLSKQTDKSYHPVIKKLLIEKTGAKNIPVDSPFHFVNEKKREINLRHWEKSLQHQLPGKYLPDFNQLYLELTTFIEKIIKS